MALLAIPCLVIGVVARPPRTGAAPGERSRARQLLNDVPLRSGLGLDLPSVQGAIEPVLLVVAVLAAMVLTVRRGSPRRASRACAAPRRGVVVASCRPRAWSTPRPPSPSRSGVCSRTCSDRTTTSRSPTSPSRATSRRRSATRREPMTGSSASLYRPVIGLVSRWGAFARRAQNGSVHRYLAYGFVALVILLVALA